MKSSSLQSSWLRNFCKIAMLAVVIGLILAPGRASACSKICPQYLAQYCVVQPDGQIATVWTNPCFACWAHLRILYMGTCKIWIGPPRTCKGTTCQ